MELIYPYSLEDDLYLSEEVRRLVEDEITARKLYSALCNTVWIKNNDEEDLDTLVAKHALSSKVDRYGWTSSWRHSGSILATLRQPYLLRTGQPSESYMDFYCSGNEGYVDKEIRDFLLTLKWVCYECEDTSVE